MLEYRYDVPFKFTGKINKLAFNLGPDQLTEKERMELHKPSPERAMNSNTGPQQLTAEDRTQRPSIDDAVAGVKDQMLPAR